MKTHYLPIAILLGILSFMMACNTKTEQKQEIMEANNNELNAIFPKGDQGPAEFFTGKAFNYGLLAPDEKFTTAVGNVYFEPGARSNWHSHPAGQILLITDGIGYHQIEGQAIEIIKKGDVVTCPPNVNHWHGASPDVGLQQLYIVPNTEKGIVDWKQAVSDAEYLKEQ